MKPTAVPGSRIGFYMPRPAGTLKAALADLVDAAGGIRKAAELVQRTVSTVQGWTDPARTKDSAPIDCVRVLEAAAGVAPVTAFLAAEAGFILSRPSTEGMALPVQVAALARQNGEAMALVVNALSDGEVTPAEAGPAIAAIDEAQEDYAAIRSTLVHIRDGVA